MRKTGSWRRWPWLVRWAPAWPTGSQIWELDCYWSSPPGDADRSGPIGALGGELTGFWEYDEDDQEWSEDYLLGDLGE